MSEFNFADRYAQAGIAPSPETIIARQSSVDRITKGLTYDQSFDLIGVYYGHPSLDLSWLVAEPVKKTPASL